VREILSFFNLKNKTLINYIKILVVSVFVILVAVQASKSFVLDEIDFPIVAHATSQSFKPIYYRGEESAREVGNYHPTLYINSLAAFIKVFGFNATTVRFFGVLCTLASALLLLLILRLLIKKNDLAECIFLGLFLLNPYTIANTTLPDIDSTILPVVLLIFLYFSMKFLFQKKEITNRMVLILGALFGLALWSKMTTPLVIPFFLVCLAFITSKDYKKSILLSLKVSIIGVITFLVTYFIYCKLLNLSFIYTFKFLLGSFTKGTSSGGLLKGITNNLSFARGFIYWPTLPVITLYGISFIGVMLDKDTTEKTRVKKLLVLIGLLVTIFYIALIAPFGGFFKYPFPVFGILILTIIFFYDRYYRDIKINPVYAFLVAFLGFLAEILFWKDSMFLHGKPFGSLTLLFLIIIAGYIVLKIKTHQIAASVFVLLIFFSIGFQLSISRIQAKSTYPTKYHYGQSGLDETTAYLRSNTAPTEIIWSMKDVGYYVNNKYIESYSYYFDKTLENNLINLLKSSKVKYYVVSTGIGEDNILAYPHIQEILTTYAVQEKQYGNFIIYKAKG
jgi:4-amino-4-deoxy-L-arabinose transferase-like glycosyltransferase